MNVDPRLKDHNFLATDVRLLTKQKRTLWVVWITTATMIVEIIAGYMTHSIALLADGWHMASHAGALLISYFAYRLAASPRITHRFSFGAGKFIPLGGYTNAIILSVVAILMAIEAGERFFAPEVVRYEEALFVAVAGLIVNVICALVLMHGSEDPVVQAASYCQHHGHSHQGATAKHDHSAAHTDHNLRSAYAHIVTDAVTSVCAIVALMGGKLYQLSWLDPLMGLIGSIVILRWSFHLCRDAGWELLDGHEPSITHEAVYALFEPYHSKVLDLHVWRVAPNAVMCTVALTVKEARGADFYRQILIEAFPAIKHVTIEERPYRLVLKNRTS